MGSFSISNLLRSRNTVLSSLLKETMDFVHGRNCKKIGLSIWDIQCAHLKLFTPLLRVVVFSKRTLNRFCTLGSYDVQLSTSTSMENTNILSWRSMSFLAYLIILPTCIHTLNYEFQYFYIYLPIRGSNELLMNNKLFPFPILCHN